jgi:hypothetical protein
MIQSAFLSDGDRQPAFGDRIIADEQRNVRRILL